MGDWFNTGLVRESRKMAYKARFNPIEILSYGAWRTLTDTELAEPREIASTVLVPESTG